MLFNNALVEYHSWAKSTASVVIEHDAVSRMLHRRLLDGSYIVSLEGVVLPGEIGLGIRRIHDADRHLSWWRRWRKAAGRVGIIRHLWLFRLIVAPDFSEISVDEVDAPTGLLADLVEDCKHFVLFGSRGETSGDGVKGAESDAGDTSVFGVSYDPTKLSRIAQLPRLHLLQHLGIRCR